VIKRFFSPLIFGTLVGLGAVHLGLASQPIQGVMAGILSGLGLFSASHMARSRLRLRQGEAPAMQPGETALLYGPAELSDVGGSSKAWIYLSNQRLILRSQDGDSVDFALDQIDELRPPQEGLFGGELRLLVRGRGLLTLKLPDATRWHKAIHKALHQK
jgi:hypothetical protein